MEPPLPLSPLSNKLDYQVGSIIHYVQQHYTINIQKLLLIGRTIVVTSGEKMHTRKQQIYPELALVFFSFTLTVVKFVCQVFSLRRKPERPSMRAYKTIHGESVQHCCRCGILNARHERVSNSKMFKILRHTYQNEVDIN